jgi:hypothetical protein
LVKPPEKPILWFTTSEAWEETATPGAEKEDGSYFTPTREQAEAMFGGLYRIGISDDYPLKRFMRITLESRQDKRLTQALITTAEAVGSNPYANWWGTFYNVPRGHWSALENCDKEHWQPCILEEAVVRVSHVHDMAVGEFTEADVLKGVVTKHGD